MEAVSLNTILNHYNNSYIFLIRFTQTKITKKIYFQDVYFTKLYFVHSRVGSRALSKHALQFLLCKYYI